MKRDELVMVVPRDLLFAGGRGFEGFTPDAGPYLKAAMAEYLFVPRRRAERDDRYKQVIPYVVIRAAPAPGAEPMYLMFQRALGGDPRLRRLYSLGLGGHVNTGDVLAAPLVWGVGEVQRQAAAIRDAEGGLPRPGGRPAAGTVGPGSGRGRQPYRDFRWTWPRPASATAAQKDRAARAGAVRVVRRIRLAPSLSGLLETGMRTRVHEHPLFRGLRRELREEVSFPRGSVLSLLGAINDDSTPVGRVHFGFTFMLTVPPPRSSQRPRQPAGMTGRGTVVRGGGRRSRARVRLKPEPGGSVQIGSFFSLEQVRSYAKAMENWSLLLLESGVLAGDA